MIDVLLTTPPNIHTSFPRLQYCKTLHKSNRAAAMANAVPNGAIAQWHIAALLNLVSRRLFTVFLAGRKAIVHKNELFVFANSPTMERMFTLILKLV